MQQPHLVQSLLIEVLSIIHNEKHPQNKKAKEFQAITSKFINSPSGREWFEFLCCFAHPQEHGPYTTPYEHGRSDVTSLLLRLSSDENIPQLKPTTPSWQTSPETNVSAEKPPQKQRQPRKTQPNSPKK